MSVPPSSSVLAAARDNFVDLDVSVWAWVLLGITLAVMLTADLIRHRDDHEPTRRGTLVESLV